MVREKTGLVVRVGDWLWRRGLFLFVGAVETMKELVTAVKMVGTV